MHSRRNPATVRRSRDTRNSLGREQDTAAAMEEPYECRREPWKRQCRGQRALIGLAVDIVSSEYVQDEMTDGRRKTPEFTFRHPPNKS